jgi:acylphosphatase
MNKKYTLKVTGKVQGVGFRFSAYLAMDELGLKGTAENDKTDGSLLIVAEGEEVNLERLVEWTKKGPTDARVTGIQVTREAANDSSNA